MLFDEYEYKKCYLIFMCKRRCEFIHIYFKTHTDAKINRLTFFFLQYKRIQSAMRKLLGEVENTKTI